MASWGGGDIGEAPQLLPVGPCVYGTNQGRIEDLYTVASRLRNLCL